MQLKTWTATALLLAAIPAISEARDTTLHLDFAAVVAQAIQAGRLDGSVKFYLAGEELPGKVGRLNNAVTNKKTNAFNKSDQQACTWVLQSALISLQNAAKTAGANAVVDIVSYYKRNEFRDPQNYECHAGTFIAGVALKGNIANVQ
ncbi:excinuclease [Pseudomonas sp. SA3-5]|uniref:Excinuclease n=1 Tax=Pseudomonas aestuarii TaxID=3018340 RepID=A0ABT4X914_9PSED|nr:excinuclease [Pseudomonas aestuarii]MDA7084867.1 excinuclease [Pseudomonas aestuarii]